MFEDENRLDALNDTFQRNPAWHAKWTFRYYDPRELQPESIGGGVCDGRIECRYAEMVTS